MRSRASARDRGAGVALRAARTAALRRDDRVGSKNFTESIVIAEIYAQALERAGLRVERRFNLGSTQIAMAAMRRGEIDIYPGIHRHGADRRAASRADCATRSAATLSCATPSRATTASCGSTARR